MKWTKKRGRETILKKEVLPKFIDQAIKRIELDNTINREKEEEQIEEEKLEVIDLYDSLRIGDKT